MPSILLNGLVKGFRTSAGETCRALDDFNLAIADREFLVVVGPSGAGKSTLLRVIAGLEKPEQGEVRFGQALVNETPPGARGVAMIFQSAALYPHLTVRENLGFGLKLRKLAKTEISERIDAAAKTLGLGQLLPRMPEQLSGGERQRVALARALVCRPGILLLDEPLAQLDAVWRDELREEILRLHHQFSCTTVYVTHDQQEAMRLGQRIAVVDRGQMRQCAAPLTLYREPADRFVAEFFGQPPMNFFPGKAELCDGKLCFVSRAGFPEMEIDSAAGIPAGHELFLGIRPEEIALSDSAMPGKIAAIVERVEHLGADNLIWLRLGAARCVARTAPDYSPPIGKTVQVQLTACRIFDAQTGKRMTLMAAATGVAAA